MAHGCKSCLWIIKKRSEDVLVLSVQGETDGISLSLSLSLLNLQCLLCLLYWFLNGLIDGGMRTRQIISARFCRYSFPGFSRSPFFFPFAPSIEKFRAGPRIVLLSAIKPQGHETHRRMKWTRRVNRRARPLHCASENPPLRQSPRLRSIQINVNRLVLPAPFRQPRKRK